MDLALPVIDATVGVTSQDQRLAERVDASGWPILVMLNKWELIDDPEQRLQVQADLQRKLYFVGDAPVLKISAPHGKVRQQAASRAAGRDRAVSAQGANP